MAESRLKAWATNKVDLCHKIASNKSKMKILLKTRDDPYFIDIWMRHHEKICGKGNIIILDNESKNPTVLDYYAKLSSESTVFSFNGFHDNVHHTKIYPELYAALRESCAFYVFLDTDEFLTRIDGDRHFSDATMLDFIDANIGSGSLSGTWLPNVLKNPRQFWLGNSPDILSHGLKWGKPIVSTKAHVSGFANHNCQLSESIGPPQAFHEMFVLHMDSLFPEQRIAVNMLKLQKMGILKDDSAIADALAVDPTPITDGNALLYLQQIKGLNALTSNNPYEGKFPLGSLELADGNRVRYSTDTQRLLMREFQTLPDKFRAA